MLFRSVVFICFYVIAVEAFCQTDNEIINAYLERYIENTEDEVDMQQFIAELTHYIETPLNLNKASASELFQAVFLTPLQAMEILKHRQQYGDFISIYELQVLDRFDVNDIQAMLPFVSLKDARERFNLRKLWSNGEHMLLSLAEIKTPQSLGFAMGDSGISRYLGSNIYNNLRYRFNAGRQLQFGFNAENDAGEPFIKGNTLGYDYVSAYLGIKNLGAIENLQIGDFQANFGQGLTLSNGLAFGKSSIITQTKRSFNGFDTYRSLRENAFLRGCATTLALGKWRVGVFASSKQIDANGLATDTSYTSVEFSSIQEEGGFHRTANELADKDALRDQQFGLFTEFNHTLGKIGFVGTYRKFGGTITPAEQLYNQFRFNGDHYRKGGMYYDFYWSNINLFGEISTQDFEKQTAQTHGALIALGQKFSLTCVFRDYERGFIHYQTNGFGEGGNTQNEKGFYTGLDFKINQAWKILGYYDVFRNPWIEFRTSSPANGDDLWLEIEYKPSRTFSVYYRYRTETKLRNFESDENLNEVRSFTLTRHRIHASYQLTQALSIRTRAEWNVFTSALEKSYGSLFFQDIRYKPFGKPLQLIGRFALANIDDFNNRIYAFENVPLYDYPLYMHSRTGFRSYLMMRYMPTKNLNFWLRFAHNEDHIPLDALQQEIQTGSGLEQRSGNSQQTITLQIRYIFK